MRKHLAKGDSTPQARPPATLFIPWESCLLIALKSKSGMRADRRDLLGFPPFLRVPLPPYTIHDRAKSHVKLDFDTNVVVTLRRDEMSSRRSVMTILAPANRDNR